MFEYADPDPDYWLGHKSDPWGMMKLKRAEVWVCFKLIRVWRPQNVRRNSSRGSSVRKVRRCPACLNLLFCSTLWGWIIIPIRCSEAKEGATKKVANESCPWTLRTASALGSEPSQRLSDRWVALQWSALKRFSFSSVRRSGDLQTCPCLCSGIQMIFNSVSRSKDSLFLRKKDPVLPPLDEVQEGGRAGDL